MFLRSLVSGSIYYQYRRIYEELGYETGQEYVRNWDMRLGKNIWGTGIWDWVALSSILSNQPHHLTQFILDCTSINLPDSYRVPAHKPRVSKVFKISRDRWYAAGRQRLRLLKAIKWKECAFYARWIHSFKNPYLTFCMMLIHFG